MSSLLNKSSCKWWPRMGLSVAALTGDTVLRKENGVCLWQIFAATYMNLLMTRIVEFKVNNAIDYENHTTQAVLEILPLFRN